MTVETNYQGMLNENESLYVTFYNVERSIVQLQRIDNANAVGEIYAGNIILKQYVYEGVLQKSHGPWCMYSFPTAVPTWTLPNQGNITVMGATPVLKEYMTGRTMISAGSAVAVSGNPYTGYTGNSNRLNGKYAMLPPNSWYYDQTNGAQSIALRDALGQAWSWTGWVFRAANTTSAWLYLESDNAISKYFGVWVTAAGVVQLIDIARGAFWNGPTIPLNQWSHVGFVYDGTTMQTYMNGVANGGAVGYAHGAQSGMTRNHVSYGGQTQCYIQSVNIYSYALASWQIDLEYNLIVNDSFNGGVINQGGTIGQGGTLYVVFNDNTPPSYTTPSVGVWQMTLPAQGVGRIQTRNTGSMRMIYDMKITERGQ